MTKDRTPIRIGQQPRHASRRGRLPMDVLAAVVLSGASALAAVAQTDTPATIIAAQIRAQGYGCTLPVAAERDRQASAPNEAVWILSCGNARYRVRLVPDMAAQVTQLD